jgi:hypothetical protein
VTREEWLVEWAQITTDTQWTVIEDWEGDAEDVPKRLLRVRVSPADPESDKGSEGGAEFGREQRGKRWIKIRCWICINYSLECTKSDRERERKRENVNPICGLRA